MATVCVYAAAGALCWYVSAHTGSHLQLQMGLIDLHTETHVPNHGQGME